MAYAPALAFDEDLGHEIGFTLELDIDVDLPTMRVDRPAPDGLLPDFAGRKACFNDEPILLYWDRHAAQFANWSHVSMQTLRYARICCASVRPTTRFLISERR
jgi:hypothetical protein